MADNDEDDDSFGEFTFAPIQTTVNSSSQIPVTTVDDDWGNFSLFQNNATDHNLKSPPSPPRPPPQQQSQTQPKWEKIRGGALPLSLFGDEEEEQEQEEPAMPVVGDDVKQSTFSSNNNNHQKSNAQLGINDLIANLYGDTQQLQRQTTKTADNGNELDSSAINSTDPLSKSNSLSSYSFNTASAAAVDQGSDDDDDDDDDDDEGGWQFIDAFSDSKLAHNETDSNKALFGKTTSSAALQGGSHGSTDLFAASNNGFLFESHVTDNGFDSKPITSFQNGFSADFIVDSKGTTEELSSNPLGGSDDFDDFTFGEFETASMKQPATRKESSEDRFDPLSSHDKSHGSSVDLFSSTSASHMDNPGFDFGQSPVVENGFVSDPFSQTEWKETKDDSDSQHADKFETTFQEPGVKLEGSEASTKKYKEPVPLSIFGIEEDSQADDSLNLEHELFKSSTHGKHTRTMSSNLSINDILSDLYSQSQPISSSVKDDSLHSTSKEYGSHVVIDNNNNNDDVDDDDDDFNDGSWEFKDASSQPRIGNQNPFNKKLNRCMEFYSILKDDLCVIARQNLHSLQKAESPASLTGEEMKVATLNKEIQEALNRLHEKDIISPEMHLDDHSERVISLDKYIETFKEPDFEALESEYHLAQRLLLAESDLITAIDLINHFSTVLKILTLAPKPEPADYVSLWFKVISVCRQELNLGTWIWKQSLEKNVHREILNQKQGRQFIIALGEIYRAVIILEAAVKFYKPWILLGGADFEGIYGLLEECHSLWSTSRLEESIPTDYLLTSIRHIQNLDENKIADEFFSLKVSQCRLSLLSPAVVPEMKLVTWNEDKYFVTLANLWANLISPDPPKLSLHVG